MSLYQPTRVMLAGFLVFVHVAVAAEPDGVPDGLSAADWSGIRATYEASRQATHQVAYLKASNPEEGVHGEDEPGDTFGDAIAVSGNTVVVGASREDSSATGVNGNQADNSARNAGAAYIFDVVRSAIPDPSALSSDDP